MRKLYYKLKIVWLSVKWMFRTNLGDKVLWIKDLPWTYTVINGVCPGSWKIKYDDEHYFEVPRNECKKIKTIPNYIHSFKSGYSFYMGYWFDIWCRNGIEPWVRKCNIW